MKPKLSVYLSDHVAERLALAARRPGANKSAIVDAALDRFLNPERDPSGDAALVRRLDRINRQLDRVDRDVGIVAETLALYVRYHLTMIPPLPLADREAARALGRDRFEMFVAQVGKRVASGNRLVAEVLERLTSGTPDLFNRALDDGMLLSGKPGDTDESPARDAAGRPPERPPAGREEVGHV